MLPSNKFNSVGNKNKRASSEGLNIIRSVVKLARLD